MSDLLKEFEQDIRRERLDQLWQRFGRMMVGLSVVVVVVTVVYVVWHDYATNRAMEQTSGLVTGGERLNAQKYKEATVEFDKVIATGDASHASLAMLRKAQAQKADGDEGAAIKTYEELAKRDGMYADLAKINLEQDKAPPRDSAFYFTRSEQYAWGLLKAGKKEEAVKIMQSLRDDNEAPRSQRNRLTQLLSHLAPDIAAKTKTESETAE